MIDGGMLRHWINIKSVVFRPGLGDGDSWWYVVVTAWEVRGRENGRKNVQFGWLRNMEVLGSAIKEESRQAKGAPAVIYFLLLISV